MTLVSVIPYSRIAGVHAPGTVTGACQKRGCKGPHTSDWREPPGSPGNTHRAEASMRVLPLADALARRWPTEVHIAGYVLTRDGVPCETQPRIAKDALAWLRSEGFEVLTTCLLADWDTPDHVPWTPVLREEFDALWHTVPALQTCGVYLSPRGARLVQSLTKPVPVEQGEASLRAWLRSLVAAGLPRDIELVHDWTRLMRAPRHHRTAQGHVAPAWEDYARVLPIPAPAPLPPAPSRPRTARPRAPRAADDPAPAGRWDLVADLVGAAIRDTVQRDWRRCYAALAGALLGRGCSGEVLPDVIGRAYLVADPGRDRLADRQEIGRSTAARWASGQTCTGYLTLQRDFPTVAEALDEATAVDAVTARVQRAVGEPAQVTQALPDALATIEREIREAFGVVVIQAKPGIGKTTAAVAHAAAITAAAGSPGARLAISAPTHRLAKQTAAKLPGRSMRVFGPVSHETGGAPTCQYHDSAEALAAGGQSVGLLFCEGRQPCERGEDCPARRGWEGNRQGSLVTGPHALLGRLSTLAGPAGVLTIDEPPDIVATTRVSLDDLDTARRYLDAFTPRYQAAMEPALASWDAWIRTTAPVDGPPVAVAEAVGAASVDAQGAILPGARSHAPPLRLGEAMRARRDVARAVELGRASGVLDGLWHGITSVPPHTVRVDERDGDRAATVCGLNPELVAALRRDGPVVVLDANASLHLPAITAVLGAAPRFVAVHVADGAPISRTIYTTAGATRVRWLPRGVPDWSAGIVTALRAAVAWAGGRRLGLVTWQTLRLAVDHVLSPEAPVTGLSRPELARARAVLKGVFAGAQVVTAHYGGLEGLDHLADCDCLATLGDPRPNLGEVHDCAEFLGLDPSERIELLAAAELEQAHGRLRTVHRTRAGHLLHVGGIVPHGWARAAVVVQRLPLGRPPTAAAMSAEEFRQARGDMGGREWARALRISHGTQCRYAAGSRAIPEDVARAVRCLTEPSR